MRNFSRRIYLVALMLFLQTHHAQSGDSALLIRPQFGIGIIRNGVDGRSGDAVHAGVRLLLAADDYKRWGLELTSIDTLPNGSAHHTRYTACGIVLERLRNWFNMSIGTIGGT